MQWKWQMFPSKLRGRFNSATPGTTWPLSRVLDYAKGIMKGTFHFSSMYSFAPLRITEAAAEDRPPLIMIHSLSPMRSWATSSALPSIEASRTLPLQISQSWDQGSPVIFAILLRSSFLQRRTAIAPASTKGSSTSHRFPWWWGWHWPPVASILRTRSRVIFGFLATDGFNLSGPRFGWRRRVACRPLQINVKTGNFGVFDDFRHGLGSDGAIKRVSLWWNDFRSYFVRGPLKCLQKRRDTWHLDSIRICRASMRLGVPCSFTAKMASTAMLAKSPNLTEDLGGKARFGAINEAFPAEALHLTDRRSWTNLQASLQAKRYPLMTVVGWMRFLISSLARRSNSEAIITTEVVPSPTSASCWCASSTKILAAGCSTSNKLKIVAPSLESVTS